MADVSLTLNTSPDGDQTVDRLVGSRRGAAAWPLISPGRTEPLQLGWDPSNSATYETVRKYVRLGGRPSAVATMVGLDTTPFYRELHAETEDLLISLDPDGSGFGSDVDGLWGVIVGGSDATNNVRTRYELAVEVFVLAELSEYANRGAAESAHEK